MADMTTAYKSELYEALRADTPFVALYSAPGVELTGNGYARVALILEAFNGTDGGANTNLVQFPTASGNWTAAPLWGICDAASAGNQRFEKAFDSPETVTTGQTLQFPIGDLAVAYD